MGSGGAGIGERELGYGGIGMGVGIVRRRVAEIDEGNSGGKGATVVGSALIDIGCDALSRQPISGYDNEQQRQQQSTTTTTTATTTNDQRQLTTTNHDNDQPRQQPPTIDVTTTTTTNDRQQQQPTIDNHDHHDYRQQPRQPTSTTTTTNDHNGNGITSSAEMSYGVAASNCDAYVLGLRAPEMSEIGVIPSTHTRRGELGLQQDRIPRLGQGSGSTPCTGAGTCRTLAHREQCADFSKGTPVQNQPLSSHCSGH